MAAFPDVPMPAAIAARPRDTRGYPVPAITPWDGATPVFAATGTARTFVCAIERRCSICALEIPPGPLWRVVAGPESEAIGTALAAGQEFVNRAATNEAPGHRACMLYAAVVCPYLARPNARRGVPAQAAGLSAKKGFARGSGGAVAGFAKMEFRYDQTVLFRFDGLGEYLPHEAGAEQLAALVAAIESDVVPDAVSPPYLLADEDAAEARMVAHLRGQLPDRR